MTALTRGKYEDYPQIGYAVNQLDDDEYRKLTSNLASIKKWKINVSQIKNNKASAEITSEVDGRNFGFIFSYSKIENQWVLDENITVSKKIDFIPFIGRED